MRKAPVILMVLLLSVIGKGQEYTFSSVLPIPSVFEKHAILDPYSLRAEESGKSTFSLKDSAYYFIWSSGDSEWKNDNSSLYHYNEDNRKDTTLYRKWVTEAWLNHTLYEYYYDDKGNRIKMVEKAWRSGEQEWENSEQRIYTYNGYQNLQNYIIQDWDNNQLSWTDVEKYLYGYDVNQNLVQYEKLAWNPDSSRWISQYRFIWTYYEGNMIEERVENWDETDSSWINFVKDEYLYTAEGNLTTDTQSTWNVNDSVWEEKTVISFSYNPDAQVVEKLYQSRDNGILVNFVLYTYGYTPSDQVSEIRMYTWETSTWNTSKLYLFDYDLYGNLIRETYRNWSAGTEDWVNEAKWEYYYTHFIEPLHAFISDSTNVSCYGYSDGTATVTITGGIPPYAILWNDAQNTTAPTVYGLSADQYYTVTVTDAALNSVSDSVMLYQPPEIITGPIYGLVNVNQFDTVTYWVESDPSSFYSWFVTKGEILSVSGGDTIVIVWTHSGQGKISVFETTTNGCEGDTVHVCVSITPTSIHKLSSGHLQIYPNPANQWITIQNAEVAFKPWDLEILDMTGKTLQSFHAITQSKFQVLLDKLSQGIYFFRITNRSGIEIRKVVVEK